MDFKKVFPKVTDDFGNWLAGFTDGEGCFSICEHSLTAYSVKFYITQRADSTEILDLIRKTLGIGGVSKNIAQYKRENGSSRWSPPISQFYVSNRHDLIKLVKFFEQYPPRTKRKLNDFNLWKEAVKEYSVKDYNISALCYYKDAITSTRGYNNGDISNNDIPLLPSMQLELAI